jgi:hypothetical protein
MENSYSQFDQNSFSNSPPTNSGMVNFKGRLASKLTRPESEWVNDNGEWVDLSELRTGTPMQQARYRKLQGPQYERTSRPPVDVQSRMEQEYMPKQIALLEYVKRTGDVNFPEYQDWVNWTLSQTRDTSKMTQAQIENFKNYLNTEVLKLGGQYGITPPYRPLWENEMRSRIQEEMRQEELRMREAEAAERRRRQEENIRRRMRGQPTIEEEESAAEAERKRAEAEAQHQKHLASAREAQERFRKKMEDAQRRAQQAMSKNWKGPSVL